MKVCVVSKEEANRMLRKHYLGPVTYPPSFCFVSEDADAVAIFSAPIASAWKVKLPGSLELARLFKSPDADYPTSQFLAACLHWLRTNTDCPCVFSYADPEARHSKSKQRHTGHVYKATGFVFMGASCSVHKWRTPEGTRVSAPSCYRRFKTKDPKKIQELNPDWKLIKGKPKLLYLFPLRKRLSAIVPLLGRYAAGLVDEPSPIGARKVRTLPAAPPPKRRSVQWIAKARS